MSMTYYEWSCKSSGYAIRHYKAWEQIRWLGFIQVKVNSTSQGKLTPQDILELPTDPEKVIMVATSKEDRQEMYEKAQERLRMMGK